MRKWHRWISTAAMVLLAWVACTGVLLAIDSMYPPAGLGGAPGAAESAASAPTDIAQPLDNAAIERWLINATESVVPASAQPDSIDVQLRMQGDQPIARVTLGNNATPVSVNAQDGSLIATPVAPAAEPTPWYNDAATRVRIHDFLQDLHRGTIIGLSGQVLDIFTGLSFVFLSISGAVMYFQLYLRRRKSGNKQWFWK